VIDPAESLLAAIGVRPVVSHSVERIGPKELAEAARLPQTCHTMALNMCRGRLDSLTVNDFDRIDYGQTLRDLTLPYDARQVEMMIAALPLDAAQFAGSFEVAAKRAFDYLYSQFPISLRKSLGPDDNNTVPPRRLLTRFEGILWLLDNPTGVFNLMANATLTSTQLDALRSVYPSFTMYVGEECIPNALEEMRVSDPKWQYPRVVGHGVKRFLGRLQVAPELGQILQSKPKFQPMDKPGAPANGVLSTNTAPRPERQEQGA
jgi:hypothetical protein